MTTTLVRDRTDADVVAAILEQRPAVAGLGLGVVSRGGGTAAATVDEYRLASRMTPRRRAEFLLGREALRRAMTDARLSSAPLVPVLEGRPRLPMGTIGALSHSGGVAVALAGSSTRFAAVGVDLELSTLPVEAAHLVLMDDERDWLALAPTRESGERALISAFCAKEAAFKAFAQLDRCRVDRLRQVRLAQRGRGFVCWPEHDRSAAVHVTVGRAGPGTFAWTVLSTRGAPR